MYKLRSFLNNSFGISGAIAVGWTFGSLFFFCIFSKDCLKPLLIRVLMVSLTCVCNCIWCKVNCLFSHLHSVDSSSQLSWMCLLLYNEQTQDNYRDEMRLPLRQKASAPVYKPAELISGFFFIQIATYI